MQPAAAEPYAQQGSHGSDPWRTGESAGVEGQEDMEGEPESKHGGGGVERFTFDQAQPKEGYGDDQAAGGHDDSGSSRGWEGGGDGRVEEEKYASGQLANVPEEGGDSNGYYEHQRGAEGGQEGQ